MSEETIIIKQCVKCQESFPLDGFRVNKKTKDGRKNECIKCDDIRAQEYYLKNKKKIIKNVLKNRSKQTKLERQKARELKELAKSGQIPAISNTENLQILQENPIIP